MIAHIYINKFSFEHNNRTDEEVYDGFINIKALLDVLKTYNKNNVLHFQTKGLLETAFLTNGKTIGDLLNGNADVSKDVRTVILSLFKAVGKDKDIVYDLQALPSGDKNEYSAIVKINKLVEDYDNVRIIACVMDWRRLRKEFLLGCSVNADTFMEEMVMLYPNLIFHKKISITLKDVIKSHQKSIIRYLEVLDSALIPEMKTGSKSWPEFLKKFAIDHNMDGASMEGKKKDDFWFLFIDDSGNSKKAYCESHLKINEDDNGNKRKYCRIYFEKPEGDVVYIGYIGEHL